MKSLVRLCLFLVFGCFLGAAQTDAVQDAGRAPDEGPVPLLVRFSGVLKDAESRPISGPAVVSFSLYEERVGGSALWSEEASLVTDEAGHYTWLLGSSSNGLPRGLFETGKPRWLGVQATGQPESTRVMLVSVPYALKAADSELFGGLPISAFMLSPSGKSQRLSSSAGTSLEASATTPEQAAVEGTGTTNFLAKFINSTTIGDAALVENFGNIGIGTTTPAARLHLKDSVARILFEQTALPARTWVFGTDNSPDSFFLFDQTAGVTRWVITAGGNMGVGTQTPAANFHIKGDVARIAFEQSSVAPRTWLIGTDFSPSGFMIYDMTAAASRMFITSLGNIGIGTTTPNARLEVTGDYSGNVAKVINTAAGVIEPSVAAPPPSAIRGDATSATGGVTAGVLGISSAVEGRGVLGQSLSSTGRNMGVYGIAVNSPIGTGVWGEATSSTDDAVGVFGRTQSNSGTGVFGEAVAASGDAVGVAGISRAAGGTGVMGEVTKDSGENYAVSGRVFNSTNAGSTAGMFINNGLGSLILGRTSTTTTSNVFRVATNGQVFGSAFNTSGADFAESVAVKEERSEYVPGDVIAIDTTGVRRFTKVSQPYSTLVAGIYSTKPGILASPHHPEDPRIQTQEIPLAVVGIVPCKVTDENGEIKAGDLLVSSSREGYAMKGTDRSRMNGAVIGKALQPMKGKTGVIEVLVSLQ